MGNSKLRDAAKRAYRSLRKLRLRNRDFSLITNNCIAGIIYHDLGLPFRSPTINLFFENEDFFRFAGHLEHYLSCEMEELHRPGISYPLGLLRRGAETVTVHFMHYDSYRQAAAKWKERAARVNPDNLYLIFEYPAVDESPEAQQAVKARFDAKPKCSSYYLTEAVAGLMAADVEGIAVEVTDGEKDYSDKFSLSVESGRLVLKNKSPVGTVFFLR